MNSTNILYDEGKNSIMILILIASSYLYNAIVDKIFFGAIIPETTRVKFIRFTSDYADEESFTLYFGYSFDDPIFTQPILESYHNYTWEYLYWMMSKQGNLYYYK